MAQETGADSVGGGMKAAIYEYSLKRRKVGGIAEGTTTSSPDSVVTFLRGIGLHEKEQECLVVLVLDAKNKVRGYCTATVGLLDRAQAHPREVFRHAVLYGACSIIVAHNHPSGSSSPSAHDLSLTRMLREAGEILHIPVIDHVIIGENSYTSFTEEGLI